MKHFVYIIHSEDLDIYYKGYSLSPYERVNAHKRNESRYTRKKGPGKLVFVQSFSDKRTALIRERSLKKYSHEQLTNLLASNSNEVQL